MTACRVHGEWRNCIVKLPQVILRTAVCLPAAPGTCWLQRRPYSAAEGDFTNVPYQPHHHHRTLSPSLRKLQCSRSRAGILQNKLFHTGVKAPSSRWGHLTSVEDAQKYLASMPVPQRLCLERAVLEARKDQEESDEEDIIPPTWRQLKLLCYHHALPFVGFGFLDNFIMITVGEYIDITVGAALSISTMAAAGIGNLISDLAGLGLADRVEYLCKLLGLPDPKLSPAQLQHRASRLIGLLGRCLGICVGCTIGMAPLLWFDDQHKTSDCDCKED